MKVYKKPQALRRADTIGIIAPAWSFDPHNFKRGVSKLCKLGFRLKYSQSIFKRHWSMAGHDKERASQINDMFADRQVKAIFSAKAGYGSMRTVPYLNKDIIKKNPKIFLGYSDITALLSYLSKIAGMVVFYGPVVSGDIHEGMNPLTLKYLLASLTKTVSPGRMVFRGVKSLRPGRATGVLAGGNMSLLMSTIGTPYEIDTAGKILFLEDIGEDLETIDDYLVQLKMAGKFKDVKGIVFGRMIKCLDHSGKKYSIKNILNDILKDMHIPIIYGFPSGHSPSTEVNVTLPLGVNATVDAGKNALIINEPAVS